MHVPPPGSVAMVSRSPRHGFSKPPVDDIRLVAGIGVDGDCHRGVTVQHRSRVAVDPDQPNLRQVHLIHHELLDALRADGFAIRPGDLGENITTRGVDLLALPRGARLRIGEDAVVEVTGLRNPCTQIDRFRRGLLSAVLGRAADGTLVRKAGVMAVVLASGRVTAGDRITVMPSDLPHRPLRPV